MNALDLRRFLVLWAVGAAVLLPVHGMPAIGSGLMGAAMGGAALLALRADPAKAQRVALRVVLAYCALLWLGALTAA